MRERTHETLVGLVHLRAVAISMVFVFHYCLFDHPLWLERVGGFGWTGVDLFFVLSGFLIARQLFVQKPSLRRFYWRRLLRIVPAYLVMLAAYELLPSIRERGELPSLWRMLTFSQNVGLDLATRGTFSHAWSLCIEEQFYLMFPLVLLALGRRRALVPFLILVGMTMRAWSWTHVRGNTLAWYEWVYYPTWGRLDGLLAGITLAAVRWRNRHAAPVGLALLVGAAFVDAESRAGSIVIFPLLALGYGAIVLAALDPASIFARVPARVSSGLARLSYALIGDRIRARPRRWRDGVAAHTGGLGSG